MPGVVYLYGRVVLIRRIKSPEQFLSLVPDVVSPTVSRKQALSRARRIMKSLSDHKHPSFNPDPPLTWMV